MGVAKRLAEVLAASQVPLERSAMSEAARTLAAEEAPLASESDLVAAVDMLVGLGPIEPLLRQPDVSDVLVNGATDVWVERAGKLERADVRFETDDDIVAAVERVLAPLGLRLDRASPAVDARLPDGSRLHAAIPPIAVDGPVVAVRRFTAAIADLDELVAVGGATDGQAALMRNAVTERRNMLISGGTGVGKTTLLNVLSKLIGPQERVVTIEDAAELQLSGHVVRLEARPANTEGVGAIGIDVLVRHALRLRPDRIIVGEVRGPEALTMIGALSSGHDGSMSTIHASSPQEALHRIETLALSGSSSARSETLARMLYGAIDVVVQLERRGTKRLIAAIEEVGS